MNEFLKDILIAVGGGSAAVIAILTVFKSMFLKMFEKSVESSFEKNMEKYKNKLMRSTTAFEFLIQKEFDYYVKVDSIYAELFVLTNDLEYFLKNESGTEHAKQCEHFKESLLRYLEIIKILKDLGLTYSVYIPHDVLATALDVPKAMQKDVNYWQSTAVHLFANECDQIDMDKARSIADDMEILITLAEATIKTRLLELTKT